MDSNAIADRLKNPFLQLACVFILFLLANAVSKLFDTEDRFPWTLAVAFTLLYILYNVIIGLLTARHKYYWVFSIISFFIMMFAGGWIAQKISGLEMDDAGTYRFLYGIFFPIYLLFIAIVTTMKKIVKLAEQDDHRFDKIK